MKIGISDGCYPGISLKEEIKYLKQHDFSTFLGCGYEEFDSRVITLKKEGISIETLHAPFHNINAIWGKGEEGDVALMQLTDAAESAARHEIPLIVVHLSSGDHPPMISDAGISRFAALMDRAKELGVTVAYENQRKLANLALMFEYYEDARFCWDIGHEACFAYGMEYMPLFGNKLAALHIHDNMGIHNQDFHMIPYDGKIDFDKVARHLAKANYNGTIMLELGAGRHERYYTMSAEEYYARAARAAHRLADTVEIYKKSEK